MTDREMRTIVEEYLSRLDTAMRAAPPDQRREVVEEVRRHVGEAWAASDHSHAALSSILDRLGTPEEFARELVAPAANPDRFRPARRYMFPLLAPVILLLVLCLGCIAWTTVMRGPGSRDEPIPLKQVIRDVQAGQVESIQARTGSQEITVTYKNGMVKRSYMPDNASIAEVLTAGGVDLTSPNAPEITIAPASPDWPIWLIPAVVGVAVVTALAAVAIVSYQLGVRRGRSSGPPTRP